ncbi:hypothetical protein Sm713_10610 [Streptomyces sp. TS71-3]|nr:hypothetical protein Sm713_10610 [Streptomyces sp. TS71-3]
MNPYHRSTTDRLLTEAHIRLAACPDQAAPPLHDLLARLVVELYDDDELGSHPPSLGRVVDQAAACLLNLAFPQRTTSTFDDDLPARLEELDHLPLPKRLRLLEAATRHTTSAAQQPPARHRSGPCACSGSSISVACGHAGPR